MKFILTPSGNPRDAHIASEDFQGQIVDDYLGGFFYDYLRNQSGHLVGVRYWGMPDSRIGKGPLASFIDDPRFLFDEKTNSVDIVFFSQEISNLKGGSLTIDTTQDFGGDGVLDFEGERAIVFDLPVSASLS